MCGGLLPVLLAKTNFSIYQTRYKRITPILGPTLSALPTLGPVPGSVLLRPANLSKKRGTNVEDEPHSDYPTVSLWQHLHKNLKGGRKLKYKLSAARGVSESRQVSDSAQG